MIPWPFFAGSTFVAFMAAGLAMREYKRLARIQRQLIDTQMRMDVLQARVSALAYIRFRSWFIKPEASFWLD